jgi:cytochrome c biogenesis factor
LIWAGGALIAIGGALALIGRLWRLAWRRRPSGDAEWRKERYA